MPQGGPDLPAEGTGSERLPPGAPRGGMAWAAPTLLVALFTAIAALTWARWGNVRVDSGVAVETAARLADGAVLYRDVCSAYGPVGVYAIAGLFRLFGTHLNVVYAAGLALLAAESSLIWFVSTRFLPRFSCAVGLAAFWVLLAFESDLFNWILPNTFASTFGMFFATAALACAVWDLEAPDARKLVLASLCTAAAGLSKLEFGAVAFGTVAIAALLFRRPRRQWPRTLAWIILPGLALSLLVLAFFGFIVSWRTLLLDNLFRVRTFRIAQPAYLSGPSFPSLGPVLGETLLRYGLEFPARAALAAAGIGLAARGVGRGLPGILMVCAAVLIGFAPGYPPFPDFQVEYPQYRHFVWSPVAWALLGIWTLTTHRKTPDTAARVVVVVSAFSVLASFRWGFRSTWPSYYAVFVPFLVLVVTQSIAGLVSRRWAPLGAALVVATAVVSGATGSWKYYSRCTFTLDYPRGLIRTLPEVGRPLKAVIDSVTAKTAPDEYVAVVPEERFINFLTGRKHPGSDQSLNPGWLATPEDGRRFIEELEQRRTRVVVVSNRAYPEFGRLGFRSYNPLVFDYIRRNYRPVWYSGPDVVQFYLFVR